MERREKMTQIDTSKWKKFKVGELFDCETTKGIASKNDLVEGNIPYVTRSAENNGKSGYCGNADRIVKGNCITIGAEGFTAFYQENDFVAGNKVYALRHRNLNNVNALYICTVLNKLSCLYSFNNARILDKIKQEVISLPIDNNGKPDWQYMGNYMKEITELATKRVEKLKGDKTQTKINKSNWKKFKVGELFECNIAKSLDFGKLEKGDTIFIGRTSMNNGVQGKVDALPCEKGNCITVSMVGDNRAFYQSKEFAASQNILILRNKRLNEKNGLFFVTLINSLLAKYNYSNTVKKKEFINETILLPVVSENTPDFDYMEEYMKDLETIVVNRIEELKEEKSQTKIDTKSWKKFKVGELFETVNNNGKQVPTGANVPSQELKSGTVPRISVTGVNNGVVGYFDSTHKNYKVYNNFISVNFLGNAFYQENNASLDMKVHCLKLKNKELNKYLALFLVTIINKLTTSYSYANQLSSTSITQLQLPLPITSEGTPDFDYMENYMKNIEDCTNNIIEQAKKRI